MPTLIYEIYADNITCTILVVFIGAIEFITVPLDAERFIASSAAVFFLTNEFVDDHSPSLLRTARRLYVHPPKINFL